MKRGFTLLLLLFCSFILSGYAENYGIWIDTDADVLGRAEDSKAIRIVRADYSDERSYIGVDAVIHFSVGGKEYALFHIVDTGGGCFTLSTAGEKPYPYTLFGGEVDAEAEANFEAEDAAKDAYFASEYANRH